MIEIDALALSVSISHLSDPILQRIENRYGSDRALVREKRAAGLPCCGGRQHTTPRGGREIIEHGRAIGVLHDRYPISCGASRVAWPRFVAASGSGNRNPNFADSDYVLKYKVW